MYGEHAISSSVLRRWMKLFNEYAKICMMISGAADRLVNEDLVRAVEEKVRENRRFTITSLFLHFPQIAQSVLHKIVSDKLKFWKLCARWVPKVLTEEHKLKHQASTLDLLTRYCEEGENDLRHVVTGEETKLLN